MASAVKRPAPLPRWFWFASLLGCTPGFKKSRCKRLLKKTMSRIKHLKGRREVQVRQLRRDVAQLLQLGQEENAENRLDRLWKEHSLLSAYIKIGEYCQFVKANLRNIAGQRECPMDLKESLASLCFSASCCADLPELQEIRDILVMKYGNTFLTSSYELLPGEHVNRLFLDAFSTKHPLEVSKKALLKSIVAEYNVVQPKKSKVHDIGGASQKTAASDTSLKQQSRHERGSITESYKQDPKLNALEQEEKHRKQIRHSTSSPTSGAFTEEHASLPHVQGAYDRKMVRQHKKEQKDSHFQGDTVQRGVNETDHGSQERTTLPHDRHGKEKFKSRLKAFKMNKKNARVSQAGQTDQLTPSNRMSFYEKSGPDESGNEVMRGQQVHGNTDNEKSKVKEVQGCVIRQHLLENVDLYGNAKHREHKHSNQEYRAETNQQVSGAHSLKHGYHDEALSEDCIAHQMLQQGNFDHKKHDPVEREIHTRSNGKVRPDGIRHAFDNVEHERELCHLDPKSKHYGRSFTNEFENEQLDKSPHRRNHHVEQGTKVDVHRIDLSLSPGEADYGVDYWQPPLTGNGVFPEQREPPNVDRNFGETKRKHKSRSNGKSRPGRATNEQVRSPCKRNQHVEGEIRYEKPRPGTEAYEMENWQALPKGNGSLPEYGDGTRKVQKEKGHSLNNNHENASTMASSVDHPNAHMSQKGRKQGRKHHLGGPQQEAWADYNEAVVPERAANLSPGSHICADDMQYDSKYHARQRERNFHLMENRSTVASFRQEAWADYNEAVVPERGMNLSQGSYIRADDMQYDSKYSARQREKNFHLMEDRPTVANIEIAWDHEAARQNKSTLEPCMDGELLPGDRGHVRQKHKRLAKKHISDHANSIRPKQEGIAEGTENVQSHRPRCTNGPHIPEDDSNNVAQREREHFPQWHNQFDPIPKGYAGSVTADTRAPPQVASAYGGWKEQKHPENLHEDLVAKPSSCERTEGNPSPSRFSNPPQRPPPPVPPYRVSSMPNRKPLNSPPAMRQRCATLETSHVRTNHEPHVHPKLPEYEDLVASFAALKNKPARPPMD